MGDKVYDNNSSIEYAYLTLIPIGNWVSCWWEKVYNLSYWKRDFMKLHTYVCFANGAGSFWPCLWIIKK